MKRDLSLNYSPYEMGILLEVYSGMQPTVNKWAPLFEPTMKDLIEFGLVQRQGFNFAATTRLHDLMAYVLNAPRPSVVDTRKPLSGRQHDLVQFLKRFIATTGTAPSRAEICEHFGFRSPNAAEELLRAAERKGYLEIQPGKARAIRVIP